MYQLLSNITEAYIDLYTQQLVNKLEFCSTLNSTVDRILTENSDIEQRLSLCERVIHREQVTDYSAIEVEPRADTQPNDIDPTS